MSSESESGENILHMIHWLSFINYIDIKKKLHIDKNA